MFILILRVVDKHIRTPGKLDQPAVCADIPFCIRRVDDGPALPHHSIHQDAARMRIRFVNADHDRILADIGFCPRHADSRLIPNNHLRLAYRLDIL